jgi:hypothetical protein
MPACDMCGVEHPEVYVHGRCHPASKTWAILTKHHITITCAQCEAVIVTLALKEEFNG